MEEILKFILRKMKENNLNYHFQTYNTDKIVYPYHIGTLLPTIPTTEDGKKEYTFQIDSFNRGSMHDLMKDTEKFEEIFPIVEGCQTITDDNQFIIVFYQTSQPIDTGEDDLKRIQTNLSIKTWKGKK